MKALQRNCVMWRPARLWLPAFCCMLANVALHARAAEPDSTLQRQTQTALALVPREALATEITLALADNATASPLTLERIEAARRTARKLGLLATITRKKARGDKFACRPIRLPRHTVRFSAPPCDPNLRPVTTPEEQLGKAVRYLLTNHYKNCKVQSVVTPIGTGNVVATEQYGNAVVVDFVMGERVQQEALYKANTSPSVIERKYKAVKQLVVQATEEKRMQLSGDGLRFESIVVKNPKTKRYALSPTETKKIIARRLLQEGRTEDMLRLYPEERENLDVWQKEFNVKSAALHRKDLGSTSLPKTPPKTPGR